MAISPNFRANLAEATTLSFEELLYEDNFDANCRNNVGDTADQPMYEKELRQVLAAAIEELKPKALFEMASNTRCWFIIAWAAV